MHSQSSGLVRFSIILWLSECFEARERFSKGLSRRQHSLLFKGRLHLNINYLSFNLIRFWILFWLRNTFLVPAKQATPATKAVPTFMSLLIFSFVYQSLLLDATLARRNTIQLLGVCIYAVCLCVYAALQTHEIQFAIEAHEMGEHIMKLRCLSVYKIPSPSQCCHYWKLCAHYIFDKPQALCWVFMDDI